MQFLAETTSSGGSGAGLVLLYLVFYIIGCIPLALVFRKADKPAWAAFVPIYNLYVLLTIVGRPGWWLILYFIPFVNIIIAIIVYYDLAKSFGHGGGFTVGLVFLSWIFLLILGLNGNKYLGPAASGGAVAAA
jgi:hypothetical protein